MPKLKPALTVSMPRDPALVTAENGVPATTRTSLWRCLGPRDRTITAQRGLHADDASFTGQFTASREAAS
jgi:hypothetical protein